ncbi:UrcA family protein [Phenylobacterium sp.]|uniref:UrcA family protein n=1 Tax=Phenylobacterium sp. TaxID=1871053 RepID=UPI00286A05F9|nr:UrcA family protein [Phenylobacterium sp.]
MRTPTLLAATLALLAPTAALAAGDQTWKVGNNSYHLYFSDLDTAAGRAHALARVERAAGKLCVEGTRARRQACVAKVVETSTSGSARQSLRLALEERASTQLARAPNR